MDERHLMRIVIELVTDMDADEVESVVGLLLDSHLWADVYDIDVEDMGSDEL